MKQQSIFKDINTYTPLASKLRPDCLEKFIGQKHLLDNGKILKRLIETDNVPSMILWGPPGVGKTSLAQIIAIKTKANFINFSAVTSGIKEIKNVMINAESNHEIGQKTILFIDEIHRFNKMQQDAFLPYVEKGSIILIGATTENPSFEVNSALLSRCKVFVLNRLLENEIMELLNNAINYLNDVENIKVEIDNKLLIAITNFSNGDARIALNTFEILMDNSDISEKKIVITQEIVEQCINRRLLQYDKHGEEHYNLISALHKSMRNSDVDAAVYWLARMLAGGEDPLYIARRVTRFASEDIGLADPSALSIATDVYQACHFIGMPECGVHLAEAVIYCALAPKSNAVYLAYEKAWKDAIDMLNEPVPLIIRNAPTSLMKDLHYGDGYKYEYNSEYQIDNIQCLPEKLINRKYYNPTVNGRELKINEWMKKINEMKNQK